MSRLATVYDNECDYCGTRDPNFVYQQYCNSSCESNHQYKLERKAKKKTKRQTLLNRIEQLENRIIVLENIINNTNTD